MNGLIWLRNAWLWSKTMLLGRTFVFWVWSALSRKELTITLMNMTVVRLLWEMDWTPDPLPIYRLCTQLTLGLVFHKCQNGERSCSLPVCMEHAKATKYMTYPGLLDCILNVKLCANAFWQAFPWTGESFLIFCNMMLASFFFKR